MIAIDNASFYSKKRLISVAQNAECRWLFLTSYSSELNPIEKFWTWLKWFLQKPYLHILLLMMLFMLLFNCGDYIKSSKCKAYPNQKFLLAVFYRSSYFSWYISHSYTAFTDSAAGLNKPIQDIFRCRL